MEEGVSLRIFKVLSTGGEQTLKSLNNQSLQVHLLVIIILHILYLFSTSV
jgi:hypothetical protein